MTVNAREAGVKISLIPLWGGGVPCLSVSPSGRDDRVFGSSASHRYLGDGYFWREAAIDVRRNKKHQDDDFRLENRNIYSTT